jgi:hypothetical protein
MLFERKALYNLLRMNYLRDPMLEVEAWQVEDYRSLDQDELFARLEALGIVLDRESFSAYVDNSETPEELTDCLVSEEMDVQTQDKIYLLIFELWRRLAPEHLAVSVFCDELDHLIYLYDRGELGDEEVMQDTLANLENILDQGADEGVDPIEVFATISASCANDLETFLYDFISEEVDSDNYDYASELIDSFYDYISDVKWFDFLRARVTGAGDMNAANEIIEQIWGETVDEPNLELNFEILSFMVQGGNQVLWLKIFKASLDLLEFEEDFKDILTICADYCKRIDQESSEQEILQIIERRKSIPIENEFTTKDSDAMLLLKIVQKANQSI